jgi:UDP-N-acetylglucosamine 1-carboxyvinyltransferase
VENLSNIRISGGNKLRGSLAIQGSKNAALPILAASMLHRGKTVLHNCPRISDIEDMIGIMRILGARVWWEGHSLSMDCKDLVDRPIPDIYVGKMRSSIILMSVLLKRFGKVSLANPGGCVIGKRPVDIHLQVLAALGAEIQEKNGKIQASCQEFAGGEYQFPKPSVGATQQGILAALMAKGQTRLYNCAIEPEVQWLIRFLNNCGGDIYWEKKGQMVIRGVKKLTDSEFYIPADRIVAGTYLCAGAITRSKITLENVPVEEMEAFFHLYGKMGGQFEGSSGKLLADSRNLGNPLAQVETQVYPGFPTDLQSPLMAVLTTVSGISHIRENIFEDRFKIVSELRKMGGDIYIKGRDAWILGGTRLQGASVKAEELRGGAALVIAGLGAKGETVVENYEFIQRGYEHICEDLSALGAVISIDAGRRSDERCNRCNR